MSNGKEAINNVEILSRRKLLAKSIVIMNGLYFPKSPPIIKNFFKVLKPVKRTCIMFHGASKHLEAENFDTWNDDDKRYFNFFYFQKKFCN